jgi:hypothetical protein
MDFTRLTQGEKIAGISGIALLLIMLIFKWFGVEVNGGVVTVEGESRNAFGAYGFFDIVLFITVVAAVGLVLISASEGDVGLPVAASAVVAGLGILSVVLVLISIISPPEWSVQGVDIGDVPGLDVTRKLGVWLGLLATIGIAYGGWRAMQEEGTSFSGEADRFTAEPQEQPDATPPPQGSSAPPPPPPPPPGQAP